MKNVLDKQVLQNILDRSNSIVVTTPRKWGTMDAAQMLQHLNKSLEAIFSEQKVKRMFLGRFLGKFILKKAISNTKPLSKNAPTAPDFIANTTVDFKTEKDVLISSLNRFQQMEAHSLDGKVHPFFGKMTGKEWNVLIYKHLDHHLKQFGV